MLVPHTRDPMRTCLHRVVVAAAALGASAAVSGSTYYWDGANTTADADGGAGTWSASQDVASYTSSYWVSTGFSGYWVYNTYYYATWYTSSGGWNSAATAGATVNWESGNSGNYSSYSQASAQIGPGRSAWNTAVFGGVGGAVTLAGTHLYAGSLVFDSAGYSLNSGSSLLGVGSITANSSASINAPLRLHWGATWQAAAGQTLSVVQSVNSVSGQTLLVTGSGDTSISGNVSSIGMLTKQGEGALFLYGSNNLSSGVELAAGVLQLGAPGALGSSGTIKLTGGTLRYSQGNATDYSSRFSTAANQRYNVDTAGRDVTWAANLTSSGGSLHKSGAGTLTLTGANTFSGPITVTGGSLVNNGSLAGALTVSAGGTLTGNGTFGGATLQSGATLSPGTSPGKQTFTDDLVVAGGATWLMQIYSDTDLYASGPLAGKRGYDTVEVVGAGLDLSGASAGNQIVLALMTLTNWSDSTAGVPTWGNLTFEKASSGPYPWVPKEFALATYTGQAVLASGQTLADIFAIDANGFFYETGPNAEEYWATAPHPWGAPFWVVEKSLGSGIYQLTLVAVPEPSTYGATLGGLGLALAALRRRRRQVPAAG